MVFHMKELDSWVLSKRFRASAISPESERAEKEMIRPAAELSEMLPERTIWEWICLRRSM